MVRATVTMLDGTGFSGEGVYMALGDRIMFERRFGVATQKLGKDDDLSEEHVTFLVHRLLVRSGAAVGDFDAFVDAVQRIELEAIADPTAPAAPPQS